MPKVILEIDDDVIKLIVNLPGSQLIREIHPNDDDGDENDDDEYEGNDADNSMENCLANLSHGLGYSLDQVLYQSREVAMRVKDEWPDIEAKIKQKDAKLKRKAERLAAKPPSETVENNG